MQHSYPDQSEGRIPTKFANIREESSNRTSHYSQRIPPQHRNIYQQPNHYAKIPDDRAIVVHVTPESPFTALMNFLFSSKYNLPQVMANHIKMLLFLAFIPIVKSYDNSCLLPQLQIPEGPVTFDACEFVIRTTDEVWNLRKNTTKALHDYFHPDYIIHSAGRLYRGRAGLAYYTFSTMTAFPDIKIQILDCFCKGNDIYGYKCTMPDILSGTNLGPSIYGPATGKKVKYQGLVNSFIHKYEGRWVYMSEYGVHDVIALLSELGMKDLPKEDFPENFNNCETWVDKFDPLHQKMLNQRN